MGFSERRSPKVPRQCFGSIFSAVERFGWTEQTLVCLSVVTHSEGTVSIPGYRTAGARKRGCGECPILPRIPSGRKGALTGSIPLRRAVPGNLEAGYCRRRNI